MKNNLKILIIYISFHNKNTEKIAKEIVKGLIKKLEEEKEITRQ